MKQATLCLFGRDAGVVEDSALVEAAFDFLCVGTVTPDLWERIGERQRAAFKVAGLQLMSMKSISLSKAMAPQPAAPQGQGILDDHPAMVAYREYFPDA